MSTTFTDVQGADRQADDGQRQIVAFSVHEERYALPITAVREIIRYITPGATGAAAGAVMGMICLRGHVLPVIDLGAQLGAPCEISENTKILVIDSDGRSVGMIVDTVEEVMTISADHIETVETDGGISDQIVKLDDRLVVLLDPERISA